MLNLGFDTLWNRYEKEQAEKERKQREQRENLLKLHSKLVAEKAASLAKKNSLLSLKLLEAVLPERLDNPNRPYTPEAEMVLRQIYNHPQFTLKGHEEGVDDIAFSPDEKKIVSVSHDNTIRLWDLLSGEQVWLNDAQCSDGKVAYSSNGEFIASTSWSNEVNIWDSKTGVKIKSFEYEYDDTNIMHLSLLYDNRHLFLVDSHGHISLYHILTEKQESIKVINNKNINCVALSRNYKYIAISVDEEYQKINSIFMRFHTAPVCLDTL